MSPQLDTRSEFSSANMIYFLVFSCLHYYQLLICFRSNSWYRFHDFSEFDISKICGWECIEEKTIECQSESLCTSNASRFKISILLNSIPKLVYIWMCMETTDFWLKRNNFSIEYPKNYPFSNSIKFSWTPINLHVSPSSTFFLSSFLAIKTLEIPSFLSHIARIDTTMDANTNGNIESFSLINSNHRESMKTSATMQSSKVSTSFLNCEASDDIQKVSYEKEV